MKSKHVYGIQIHATGSFKLWDVGIDCNPYAGIEWAAEAPKECSRLLFTSKAAREKVLDEKVRPESPAGRWINSDAGKAAITAAYLKLTGKSFAEARATTHNGAHQQAWPRIRRCVLGHGDRTRTISGGIRIADLLEAAKCPR